MLWSRSLLLFVKEALKIWNRDVFGNVQDRVAKQRNRVVELQGMLQGDPFNQDLINLEKATRSQLHQDLSDEESLIKQKSRVHWLNETPTRSSSTLPLLRGGPRILYIGSIEMGPPLRIVKRFFCVSEIDLWKSLIRTDLEVALKTSPSLIGLFRRQKVIMQTCYQGRGGQDHRGGEPRQSAWTGWISCSRKDLRILERKRIEDSEPEGRRTRTRS